VIRTMSMEWLYKKYIETNYEVQYLVKSTLDYEIEGKKKQSLKLHDKSPLKFQQQKWKKKTLTFHYSNRLESIKVNMTNLLFESWNPNNPIQIKYKNNIKPNIQLT
jgi:hypothetical protein